MQPQFGRSLANFGRCRPNLAKGGQRCCVSNAARALVKVVLNFANAGPRSFRLPGWPESGRDRADFGRSRAKVGPRSGKCAGVSNLAQLGPTLAEIGTNAAMSQQSSAIPGHARVVVSVPCLVPHWVEIKPQGWPVPSGQFWPSTVNVCRCFCRCRAALSILVARVKSA